MITKNKYEKALKTIAEYERDLKIKQDRKDTEIDEAILKLSKGDYLVYNGGSNSKHFVKGKLYRLTGQPYRDRVNIISGKGVRTNTKMRFFTI